jgi:hypothetical protein
MSGSNRNLLALFGYAVAMCSTVLVLSAPSRAADIDFTVKPDHDIIVISGQLVRGDYDRFERITEALHGDHALVVLDSPGGRLFEGLQIGASIHDKHYDTAVLKGDECASACGLIWLAGRTRYLSPTGAVGFHAAYIGSGDEARESGSANAAVGAYLDQLGLSMKAILFLTSAAPSDMQWLHFSTAAEVGIEVYSLAAGEAAHAPQPAQAPVAPARQAVPAVAPVPVANTLNNRAVAFVSAYYQNWLPKLVGNGRRCRTDRGRV